MWCSSQVRMKVQEAPDKVMKNGVCLHSPCGHLARPLCLVSAEDPALNRWLTRQKRCQVHRRMFPASPKINSRRQSASQVAVKKFCACNLGLGSPETDNLYQECTVAPMARERFLQFRATLPKAPPPPQRKKPVTPGRGSWCNLA